VTVKYVRFIAIVAVFACAVVQGVPITLFTDVDTYLERAQDVVIAKCVSVPEVGLAQFDDGVYPVTADVITALKGERKPGRLSVATIYAMRPGETYLLASSGGQALGTDFLALPELSVVPIPENFDLAGLKGKKAKQQVQLILARYLYEVEQKLAPLRHTEGLLQKALLNRNDDVYESRGNVRIREIRGAATRKAGSMVYLEFQGARLQWSHAMPGKSGYLYFKTPGANVTEWEFAASDHRDINAFDGKPLTAKFFGSFSPSRDKRLGQSSENSIKVEVGQIVLVRNVKASTTIFVLKIEKQEQDEAMTVQYFVLPGE
jgi:hypothetical protein